MRYVICEYERFPTLDVDDCTWREPPTNVPGYYPDELAVDLPEELVARWRAASEALSAAEREIVALWRAADARAG